jgi:hypothetical protein
MIKVNRFALLGSLGHIPLREAISTESSKSHEFDILNIFTPI